MGSAEQTEGSSTRHRILQISLSLMSQRGVDGTSMRDLAAAAGLNVASLYHYFPSKRDLLEAVLVEHGYPAHGGRPPVPRHRPVAGRPARHAVDRHPRLHVRRRGLRAADGGRGHPGRGNGPRRRARPLRHVPAVAGELGHRSPPRPRAREPVHRRCPACCGPWWSGSSSSTPPACWAMASKRGTPPRWWWPGPRRPRRSFTRPGTRPSRLLPGLSRRFP